MDKSTSQSSVNIQELLHLVLANLEEEQHALLVNDSQLMEKVLQERWHLIDALKSTPLNDQYFLAKIIKNKEIHDCLENIEKQMRRNDFLWPNGNSD